MFIIDPVTVNYSFLKKAGFPSFRLFCCCWAEILLYIDRYYNERIVH